MVCTSGVTQSNDQDTASINATSMPINQVQISGALLCAKQRRNYARSNGFGDVIPGNNRKNHRIEGVPTLTAPTDFIRSVIWVTKFVTKCRNLGVMRPRTRSTCRLKEEIAVVSPRHHCKTK